jgi:perosamine synthetase
MERDFIPVSAPVVGERELAYVTDAVRSGWVSSIGPYVDRFESSFARYVGVTDAIAVANGTVALHLALHALDIGRGDEVIIPDLTFAATAHAVLLTGATPVLADVDPDSWCIDPAAVRRAVGPHTRAILPVHLYGQAADMTALAEVAAACDAVVIEDAAEAHGATWAGRMVGSLGRAAAFSFYGNKVITTGEGGMITTDDGDLAARLRFLKDHGMSKERRYFHSELAFNYRMTNLQAALGVAQLEHIETFVAKKRLIHAWYLEALGDVEGLRLNPSLPDSRNVFWMTSAILPEGAGRDDVSRRLREEGIDSRPFFLPMSWLPHLSRLRKVSATGEGSCPVAADLSRRGLNLPSGCALTYDHVTRAARALRDSLLSRDASRHDLHP